ncbi:hypothetical protein ACGFI3_10000 [Nonomuraea wenchangensis]
MHHLAEALPLIGATLNLTTAVLNLTAQRQQRRSTDPNNRPEARHGGR